MDKEIKYPKCGYMIAEAEDTPPPILYQYTTMDVLYGMLKDVNLFCEKVGDGVNVVNEIKLRASLATYMNDPSEFDYLIEKIRNEYRNKEGFINSISGEMTSQRMFYYGPFIRSFSGNEDDLPMWNEYGQKGKGVAIGFDSSVINSLEEKKEWRFERCEYEYDQKEVEKELLELAKLSKEIPPKDDRPLYEYDKPKWEEHKAKMEEFILTKRAITKHTAYEYEKEWRLYKILPKPPGGVRMNEKRYVHKYRETNGLIIPYEEIPIPVSAIRKIVIGPTAHKEKAYDSLKMFLESRGLKVDASEKPNTVHIVNSKVPYTLL